MDTKTRVLILMHTRELTLTSNTARLANLSLKNSEIRLRGSLENPLDVSDIFSLPYEPLLLYPSENAEVLTPQLVQSLARPALLIVPDGNWRQAAKVSNRVESLKKIRHVKLVHQEPSKFLLRRQKSELGLSTMEAIARALGILESEEVKKELEKIFEIKMRRHMATRGFSNINF